eukprot:m51a1_g13435 hypothetical protein (273) ;mRNA; r:278-1454
MAALTPVLAVALLLAPQCSAAFFTPKESTLAPAFSAPAALASFWQARRPTSLLAVSEGPRGNGTHCAVSATVWRETKREWQSPEWRAVWRVRLPLDGPCDDRAEASLLLANSTLFYYDCVGSCGRTVVPTCGNESSLSASTYGVVGHASADGSVLVASGGCFALEVSPSTSSATPLALPQLSRASVALGGGLIVSYEDAVVETLQRRADGTWALSCVQDLGLPVASVAFTDTLMLAGIPSTGQALANLTGTGQCLLRLAQHSSTRIRSSPID